MNEYDSSGIIDTCRVELLSDVGQLLITKNDGANYRLSARVKNKTYILRGNTLRGVIDQLQERLNETEGQIK